MFEVRAVGIIAGWALLAAATATSSPLSASPATRGRISVAPNVQISKDRPDRDHGEPVICASITDPKKMIAAATSQGANYRGEFVYYSNDAGRTWSYAMDTFSRTGYVTGDPACAASPTGALQFMTMHIGSTNDLHTDRPTSLLNYRSPDGGRTWDPVLELAESDGAVREFTAFDTTSGPFRGRYYIFFNMGFNQRTTQNQRWTGLVALSRSLDDGKTWQPAAVRAKALHERATQSDDHEGGNVVVAPNGVVYSPYIEQYGPENKDAAIYVIASADGGATLEMPHKVSEVWRPTSLHRPTHPIIAVDSSRAHNGRLYVAWSDVSSGRMEIVLSSSDDGGVVWTRPIVLAEPPNPVVSAETREMGPFHAWVSVNKDGVVGVMWLDPRGLPNLTGFNVYFTASLDGGETWLPVSKVSDAPDTPVLRVSSVRSPFHLNDRSSSLVATVGWETWDLINGDLTWMDTDLNGRFWPVWTDTRTGSRQIWTSPITITGAVVPARPLPTNVVVVSQDFNVSFGGFHFDGDKGDVEVRLKNIGKETIKGALMIRALDMDTGVADDVRSTNSDNGVSSRGAVWDFSSLIPASGLVPGATTRGKILTFRLIHPKALTPQRIENGGLVTSNIGTAFSVNFEVLATNLGRPAVPPSARSRRDFED